VLAFASEIAEPDRDGGALRYRGVDIEELSGRCPSRASGGCSSTAVRTGRWRPAGTHPLGYRTGDTRVDVQSAIAALAPEWGFGQLVDVSAEVARDQLARTADEPLLRRPVRPRRRRRPVPAPDRRGPDARRALPAALAR